MEDICVLSNFFLRSGDPIRSERLAQTVNSNVDQLIASAFGIDRHDVSFQFSVRLLEHFNKNISVAAYLFTAFSGVARFFLRRGNFDKF